MHTFSVAYVVKVDAAQCLFIGLYTAHGLEEADRRAKLPPQELDTFLLLDRVHLVEGLVADELCRLYLEQVLGHRAG